MSGRVAQRAATLGAIVASALLLAVLVVPVVFLVVRGGATGISALGTDAELRGALLLTSVTATVATVMAMLLGTPLAYLLARNRLPGGALVMSAIELPLLIPHPVAGIALLIAFGRGTPAGDALARVGLGLLGSPVGILLAMLFVSAPLYVSAARDAIARVDVRYESVARTLGDSEWRAAWRVTRPMAARGLTGAVVVMWARAVSEFGAIAIVTYNPKVASVLSYDRFITGGIGAALPVAAVLVLLSLVPLLALHSLRLGDTDAERHR